MLCRRSRLTDLHLHFVSAIEDPQLYTTIEANSHLVGQGRGVLERIGTCQGNPNLGMFSDSHRFVWKLTIAAYPPVFFCGRSAMFGITVGMLTEYWTGQSIPQQIETFAQLLGLLPLDYDTYFQ